MTCTVREGAARIRVVAQKLMDFEKDVSDSVRCLRAHYSGSVLAIGYIISTMSRIISYYSKFLSTGLMRSHSHTSETTPILDGHIFPHVLQGGLIICALL